MPRFPGGLLVIGDALCSLDPTHGQGMTIAALEALTLRDCLRTGDAQLAQRFFRATARYIGATWAANKPGTASVPAHISLAGGGNDYRLDFQSALNAAAHDVVLTERFLRVSNFIDPPSRLRDPVLLPRIVLGNLRARFTQKRNSTATAPVARAHTAH